MAPWRTRLLLAAAVLASCAFVFAWWAIDQGYIFPPTGYACDDEGYGDPPPSFDTLVNEYSESPYCARVVRDENWY